MKSRRITSTRRLVAVAWLFLLGVLRCILWVLLMPVSVFLYLWNNPLPEDHWSMWNRGGRQLVQNFAFASNTGVANLLTRSVDVHTSAHETNNEIISLVGVLNANSVIRKKHIPPPPLELLTAVSMAVATALRSSATVSSVCPRTRHPRKVFGPDTRSPASGSSERRVIARALRSALRTSAGRSGAEISSLLMPKDFPLGSGDEGFSADKWRTLANTTIIGVVRFNSMRLTSISSAARWKPENQTRCLSPSGGASCSTGYSKSAGD